MWEAREGGGSANRCKLPHVRCGPQSDLDVSKSDDEDDVLCEADEPGLEAVRIRVVVYL